MQVLRLPPKCPLSGVNLSFIGYSLRTRDGRKCEYRSPGVNGHLCGKAEVGREPGNGKLPPETFRLVGPNITKHLTAGICSEADVQKFT